MFEDKDCMDPDPSPPSCPICPICCASRAFTAGEAVGDGVAFVARPGPGGTDAAAIAPPVPPAAAATPLSSAGHPPPASKPAVGNGARLALPEAVASAGHAEAEASPQLPHVESKAAKFEAPPAVSCGQLEAGKDGKAPDAPSFSLSDL